jgi:hypothetical protein
MDLVVAAGFSLRKLKLAATFLMQFKSDANHSD